MAKNFCKFLLLVSLFMNTGLPAQSVFVPLNHRLYQFLERMGNKKLAGITPPGAMPISRKKTLNFLLKIRNNDEKLSVLTDLEKRELDYLIFQFRDELKKNHENFDSRIEHLKKLPYFVNLLPKWFYGNNQNLIFYQDGDFYFALDPIFRFRALRSNSDSSETQFAKNHFTNGLRAYGRLNQYVSFYFNFRDNKEWGSQKYRLGNYTLPRLGFVRATSPDYIYHDETEAYLRAGGENFHLTFGKFKNIWGRGKSGSLILSDYATSYDQLKFEYEREKFYFTSTYAYLIDYHELKEDTLQGRKFLAGHRLEINPYPWLSLGFTETVIFAGRNFEPAYLNPIMFLRSAEHYLGSPDNMLMSADFRILPAGDFSFYGELLLDDITTTRLGTDWYGNKFGFLAGIFLTRLPLLKNSDLRLEYVRIRPYVYTHERSVNYTHYSSSLGHWTGPNSDLLWAELNFYATFRWKMKINTQFRRQGKNTAENNVGGDIEAFWTEEAGFNAPFLAGDRRDRFDFALQSEYEILPEVYLKSAIIFSRTKEKPEGAKNHQFSTIAFWTSVGMNF